MAARWPFPYFLIPQNGYCRAILHYNRYFYDSSQPSFAFTKRHQIHPDQCVSKQKIHNKLVGIDGLVAEVSDPVDSLST
jgi:hypothetical protein